MYCKITYSLGMCRMADRMGEGGGDGGDSGIGEKCK